MNSFNSKILLFGEYTILNGSMALAIPFANYTGKLVLPAPKEKVGHNANMSNKSLKKWAIYLTNQKSFSSTFSDQKLLSDLLAGLYFDSSIPNGYGVGSSGALTAAVYSRYFLDAEEYQKYPKISLKDLRADLSLMESYFHGTSSGIDPLVSYLNTPLLINEGKISQPQFTLPNDMKILLIDTGAPSKTGNLVKLFHEKMENNLFNQEIAKMGRVTNHLIDAFITNSPAFEFLEELSSLQQSSFKEMLLINNTIYEALIQFKGSFFIKLCGSGGGGFLLGFAQLEKYEEISQFFNQHHTTLITVPNPS